MLTKLTVEGSHARGGGTGLGVSTVLFALWGCQHACVVHSEAEVTDCRQHLESPLPTIDWFDAASMLRAGGVTVLDDAQLPQVRLGLFDFLNRDPRWTRTRRQPKWVAYQRRESGALSEEWVQQPFLGPPMLNRYKDFVPPAALPFLRAAGRRLRLL